MSNYFAHINLLTRKILKNQTESVFEFYGRFKNFMKQRILLLSMPNYASGFDRAARFPNLGLASIAGNVNEDLIDKIAIIDLITVRTGLKKYLIKLLKSFQPDIIGLSAMSFQYQTAVEIAKIIKHFNKKIYTIFGGYHITLAYDIISNSEDASYIDFMIRKEGEIAFNNLVRALAANTSKFSEIKNLSYKENGEFIHNKCAENIDLSKLKIPKRNIRIRKKYFVFGKRTDVIETSRGCTMNCSFCCMPFMYGRTFRKYDMNRIKKDIENAIANGAESLFIVDDNTFLDIYHMHNFCDMVIKNKFNKIDYLIQASVRGIASDENFVRKMAKAGFKFVFLGIENVDTEDIKLLSKDKQVLTESVHAVKLLQENNIICAGGFIVALPADTKEKIWNNFHFARKIKLDAPFFFVATPHLKTEFRKNLIEEKAVTNYDDFCFYNGLKVNVRTKSLSSEQISYILSKMNGKYGDFEYIKFNKIKKIYPLFFWKTILKCIPRMMTNKLRKILHPKNKYINYIAGRKRLIKRLRKWLLDREEVILSRLKELNIRENL